MSPDAKNPAPITVPETKQNQIKDLPQKDQTVDSGDAVKGGATGPCDHSKRRV